MSSELPLPVGCVASCRACAHRRWTAEASAIQKEQFLAQTLHPWRHVLHPLRQPEPARRWGYRTRVRLSTQWIEGAWAWGMEPRGDFLALPQCPIHAPWLNAFFADLLSVLPGPPLLPLRYLVQAGRLTTLVVKVMPERAVSLARELQSLIQPVLARHPAVAALWLHAHPAAGRRLFAKRGWFCLQGPSWVQDERGLWHGPTAFQQALPELHQASVEEAVRWLQPKAGDAVIDLYCGIGSTLRLWRELGLPTLGVESTPETVEAARRNAPGAEVLVGYCASRLPQLRAWAAGQTGRRLRVYLNPPRLGIEPEITHWLATELRPTRLAYLSCSPGTLARDLHLLTQHGYQVCRLQPYDFFPQTLHVETLACLEIEA